MRTCRHHFSWPVFGSPRIKNGLAAGFCFLFCLLGLLGSVQQATADNLAEYQIKAGFLYNFAVFTEWPVEVGKTLNLCVYGPDPFGEYLDKLQDKRVGERSLAVKRVNNVNRLDDCQIVFITRPMFDNLLRVLDRLSGKTVLTVADSPGAILQGVILNINTRKGTVTFEANLAAAHSNGLKFSSKLLRLATEVKQ